MGNQRLPRSHLQPDNNIRRDEMAQIFPGRHHPLTIAESIDLIALREGLTPSTLAGTDAIG